MLVEPRLLDEVISVTPAIRASCRSSGVATDDAMISGLAPGSAAETCIVGNATSGNGETGRTVYASAPANATATVNSVVATGRWINGEEILKPSPPDRYHSQVLRSHPFQNARRCDRMRDK